MKRTISVFARRRRTLLAIFWFGAVGCAVSILLLYFVPLALGADYYWVALLVGALYGALNGEQAASLMPVLGLDASPSGVASAIAYSHPAAAER